MPRNFSDLEKVWKMEIKSGKMVKKFFFFSKLQQVVVVVFFRFGSISPVRLHRIMKEALFLRFLRSLLITKRNYYFGKKSGKSLEFWIKNLFEPQMYLLMS